jgi:hypothetical protein
MGEATAAVTCDGGALFPDCVPSFPRGLWNWLSDQGLARSTASSFAA